MSGALAVLMGGPGLPDIAGGSASRSSLATATASYTLGNDGIETLAGLGTSTRRWTASAPALYEVRATLTAGAITSGTLNTWQSLATSRAWACTQGSIGTSSATLLIEVRASGVVLDSASVSLYAEVTP